MSTRDSIGGAGTIRVIIVVVVFGITAVLLRLFGHPSRVDWLFYKSLQK
ncbi:MAG: hypothetical protein WB762_21390 [Candidatus Sulfotelmatobacter sp.]